MFTIVSAATVGWVVGTRQYGLLDWLIAGSFLCLLIGLIFLAQSNLRLRSLRRRHREADVRGASDLVVLSRIEVLHLRGTAFSFAGATGLIAGGVALAFLGTAISAALVSIMCFVGGVLVTASVRRWDQRGFAVTAFVASAVSSPSSPQETFTRMTPAGEQRQAMLQVYGADEPLRAGREVLAIAQDEGAYWPSLDNLPGHSFTARLVLRVRMLALLRWQIASAAVIALILAALVDFPFWPPLPGPNAAFSTLVDALSNPETAEDEAAAEDTQTESDQASTPQNEDESDAREDGDQGTGANNGSDSQNGSEQGDGKSPDGNPGESGRSDGADSGAGDRSSEADSDGSDGASEGDGVNDGKSQGKTGDGASSGESDGGSETGDGEDSNSPTVSKNGQGLEPKDQSGQDSSDGDASGSDGNDKGMDTAGGDDDSGSDESDGDDGSDSTEAESGQVDDPNDQPGDGEETGSDRDEQNDTSGDQAAAEDGGPSDQSSQDGSEASTESEGSRDQGQASGTDGGDGNAQSAGAEGGPSEGGEPAPDPSEPQIEKGTEDIAPSGAQSSEPGASSAGSPDHGTDDASGGGDGTGATGDQTNTVPTDSAGGTAAGREDMGPGGAAEGAVEAGSGEAKNAAQGVDAAGEPGSLGEQSGLGELVETDTPQEDLPLVEGVRVLAPEGEVGISADLNHGSVVSLANPGGLAEPVEASPMTRNLSDEDLNSLEFPPPKQSLPTWISDLMQPQK